MKKIEIEELKRLQIEILNAVHDSCIKNNIDYWLDSGTLLGAIRHKGYIPWDDDIDIGMLRSAYEKFREVFNLENERYKFVCAEDNDEYCYAYGKVLDTYTVLYEPDRLGRKLAVNIDIIVYDNAPNDDKEVTRMYRIRDFYRGCNVARTQKNDVMPGLKRKIAFKILNVLLHPFPQNYFARKMSENAQKLKDQNTKRVGNFTCYAAFACEKTVFDSFIEHEFEGNQYMIPVGYDKWLKAMYGEYMRLPPEEKRVSTHTFEAYWLCDRVLETS
ncbi:MAG: LicD family protein [Lachnospiraceae bacterium]|nr:LicD family protein [Lachnospiraceae bacterium]